MKIFKNYSYQILSTIYIGILSFILNIFLARYLGPEDFGFYNLVIISSSFFLIFFESGLRNFIIKENIFPTEINNKHLLSNAFANGLVILIFLLIFFYILNIKKEYLFGLICFFFISQQQLISFFLKGKNFFLLDAVWQSCIRTFSFFMIIFIFFLSSKEFRVVNIFIVWSCVIIILIYLLKNKIKFKYSFYFNLKIYKYTFFFLLIDIIVFINFKSDLYLLKILNYNNYTIGLYSVSMKFVEMVAMLTLPLSIVMFASLRKNFHKIHQFKKNFYKFLKLFILFSISIFLFFLIFEKKLIYFFYGDIYFSSYKYLYIMKYLILFLPLTGFLTYALISRDLIKEYFLIILIALIFKIIFSMNFNLILNEYSIIYGSLISEIFILLTSFFVILIKLK